MAKQRNHPSDSSIVAELTILHELSAFVMADTRQQLIWEVIEKVTRFFGTTYFAVVSGTGQNQELSVSFGLDSLAEVLARVQDIESYDNRMVIVCYENTAEQSLLYFEQALPIDDRTRRLYGILAGRFSDSMNAFRLKEKKQQIETALLESQRTLRAVLDTIPVRVFWKDKNLTFLGCNKLFAQDAGYSSPSEVIGKDDFQMVWKEQALLYRADDQKVLDTGVEILNYEEPQTAPDKTIKTLRVSKIPLRDQDNNILGVLGAYDDITAARAAQQDKERLQQQLIESQKLESIGRLAGGVAHDFNNKLGVIIGYAEMAISELAPENPLRADLEEILKAAKSSAELAK
ncbi:MAG: Sensory box protein, partial [uncultured bacterium]